jgi:hypothetical protein
MIVKISKKASDAEIKKALNSLSKKRGKKGFSAKKFFGKLVRGLDGLSYQRAVRNEWN